jgi:DNA-directed RNA polymerase specialized sigma24 family protein
MENLVNVRGRLRSYFLGGIKNHIISEWKREHAQKRGGEATHLSIDAEMAEKRYQNEPNHSDTPEKLFERQWALTLMSRALSRLRNDYVSANKGNLFDGLQPYLDGKSKHIDCAEIGRKLDMKDSAVRVALHRLRHRFRQSIEKEIAETVENDEEVAEEIQHLFGLYPVLATSRHHVTR